MDGAELRDLGTLPGVLRLMTPFSSSHILWGGGGCGSLMIQMVCTQGSQSCLAVNKHQDAVPKGGPGCFQTMPSTSPSYWAEETAEIT
jgi:hypothetical protein